MSSHTSIHNNLQAQHYISPKTPDTTQPRRLHQQLPHFATTTLRPLPDVAAAYNVRAVYLKEEGNRASLPAYKILGASWATFRAICEENGLDLNSSLETVSATARQRNYTLYAATAGNHGRAIARMAKNMGITAQIYVDTSVNSNMANNIRGEGAKLIVMDGGYDNAAKQAAEAAANDATGLLIQDFSFDADAVMPLWHTEGYGVLFTEVEEQLQSEDLKATHIVVPCGGGTCCHAAVEFSKSQGRNISVLAVECDASPCLQRSLRAGENLKTPEGSSFMGGMISPIVSPVAWPVLSKGVDTSVVITDDDSLAATKYLRERSANVGPCSSGTFSGFRSIAENDPAAFYLTSESVVVVICTDGQSKDPSIQTGV